MAVTVRDEWLPRSIMVLCLGTVLLLLLTHWRSRSMLSKFPQPDQSQPQTIRSARLLPRQAAAAAVASVSRPIAIPTPIAVRATVLPVSRPQVSTTAPAPDRQLIVDLSDRQVYVYQQQKVLVSYPIAIGKDGWETPQGTFQVEQKRTNPQWTNPINGETMSAGPDNPLGSRWIGFWSDATSEIGFHGTNQEELIGMAVSHGCLRMRNQDVEDLFEKVKVGTLVTIRP